MLINTFKEGFRDVFLNIIWIKKTSRENFSATPKGILILMMPFTQQIFLRADYIKDIFYGPIKAKLRTNVHNIKQIKTVLDFAFIARSNYYA